MKSTINNNKNQQFNLNSEKQKQDILKLCLQTLNNLGFEKSYHSLEKESGVSLEDEEIQKFRQAILLGQYKKSILILQNLSCQLSQNELQKAKFLIYQENFLENLEQKNIQEALKILRQDIHQIIKEDQKTLNKLSILLTEKNIENIKFKFNWKGTGINSRKILLKNIYEVCKPGKNMIPSNRFQQLIRQSKLFQINNCPFHREINPNFSIIKDHNCNNQDLPINIIQQDKSHKDEVWIVKFSPDGKLVASLSKGQSLIIWQVTQIQTIQQKIHKSCIHESEVHCINWKYDSKQIGTASADRLVKIWDSQNGNLLYTLKGHKEVVCSILWNVSQKIIYTGGIDSYILLWSEKGKSLKQQIQTNRNMELHITEDGSQIIAVNAIHYKIQIICTKEYQQIGEIQEKDCIISTYLSQSQNFLLVNTSYTRPQIHLWSLETYQILNKFEGFKQEKYMLRCCFGWNQELIIGCGSEDGNIYLWHRHQDKCKLLNMESKNSLNDDKRSR